MVRYASRGHTEGKRGKEENMRMGAWEVVEKHTEGILSEGKRRKG